MIRMGLIGLGTMGAQYTQVLFENEDVELVAICDKIKSKAKDLADKYDVSYIFSDYEEMLRCVNLDAVVIATPDFAHTKPVISCLKAGKDVLCEKPLAITIENCQEIVKAVEESGKKLMVNYGNRHRPRNIVIKDEIEKGKLGNIQYVYVCLNEMLEKTLKLNWVSRTTPTFFLLSHCVDLIMWLTGLSFKEVYGKESYSILKKKGINAPDSVAFVCELENGAIATLESCWTMPSHYAPEISFKMKLFGDKGCIEADLFPHDLNKYDSQSSHCLDYTFSWTNHRKKVSGWWVDSVNYFIYCLKEGINPHPSVYEGKRVSEVILAMDKSCKEGRPIKITTS